MEVILSELLISENISISPFWGEIFYLYFFFLIIVRKVMLSKTLGLLLMASKVWCYQFNDPVLIYTSK